MDRTQEVGQNLASSSRYQKNSRILHFPIIQKFEGDEKSLIQELKVGLDEILWDLLRALIEFQIAGIQESATSFLS